MFRAVDFNSLSNLSHTLSTPAQTTQHGIAGTAQALALPMLEVCNPNVTACFEPHLLAPSECLQIAAPARPVPRRATPSPEPQPPAVETNPGSKRKRTESTEDYRELIKNNIGKADTVLIQLPETSRIAAPSRLQKAATPMPEVMAPPAEVCARQARAILEPLYRKFQRMLDKSPTLKNTMNHKERFEAIQTIQTALFLDNTSVLGWSMLAALAETSGRVRMGSTEYSFSECLHYAKDCSTNKKAVEEIGARLKQDSTECRP
ncbi:hypothetical protein [Limnobacter parvus]|uniref:Uncharacterized protein n=1 Tax=Limnobacter parvus TaxID=2939690 RepID=A0ABT1XFV0_9BURK|nr:hypothetical protein [Limnobacter parvus]MCR2746173.1 hypothetical protein [Limnobacter parvus]